MKTNRIGYYIREGVSSIFTHGFMSFASVFIIVACLIIMGSFALMAVNVNNMIGTLEDDNQVLTFVNENYTEEQARALEPALMSVPNVRSVTFITRNTAMDSFVKQYDSVLLEGMDSSILRDRYIVYLEDISLMEQTQYDLAEVQGVAEVRAHIEISRGFVTLKNVVSLVSIALVAILFVISLFIMSNTVKLTTFERREEIAIMKMVGATSGFIRCPFIVEGLLLGLFGSLSAYVIQWGLYELLAEKIVGSSGISFLTMLPFGVVALPMLCAFLALGLGVGIIGSSVAIRNYLKV